MEQEILTTLQDIRFILYIILIVTLFTVVTWIIGWIANIRANFQKVWDNDFINLADKYFESADFEKLIDHCEQKLKSYPNHSNATWWMARGKQEQGKADEAKALFERLLELEPSWKESHIEPYLKKISDV